MKMCKKYLNDLLIRPLSPMFSLCWEGGSCDQLVKWKEDRTVTHFGREPDINDNLVTEFQHSNDLKKMSKKSNFFYCSGRNGASVMTMERRIKERKRETLLRLTLRGVKSNMNAEHERAITKQKIQRKKLVKEGRRKRKRLRKKNGQKQKRRERKGEVRGCCSARIKARSLSCPTFPQKSEEKKKIQRSNTN